MTNRPLALLNARLIDPAAGTETRGGLLIIGGVIADLGGAVARDSVPADAQIIDCAGDIVAPGLIDTPIYGEGEDSEKFKAHLGQSVLFPNRLGQPDELASMVIELVTNSYMNAEVVRVDGGIRMPPK